MAYNNYYLCIIVEELPQDAPPPRPLVRYNQSFQGDELKGGIINCASAVVGAVTLALGVLGEVPTGGLSTAAVVVGYVGMQANGVQCINSAVRTVVAYEDPLGQQLQSWDSNKIYSYFMQAVDIVNLASGFLTLGMEGRNLTQFLRMKGALASEREVAAMTNAQRVEAYQNAFKNVSKNPAAAAELEKIVATMQKNGVNMENASFKVIKKNMGKMAALYQASVFEKIRDTVRNLVIASTTVGLNGLPPQLGGSASGTMNKIGNLVIHVIGPD